MQLQSIIWYWHHLADSEPQLQQTHEWFTARLLHAIWYWLSSDDVIDIIRGQSVSVSNYWHYRRDRNLFTLHYVTTKHNQSPTRIKTTMVRQLPCARRSECSSKHWQVRRESRDLSNLLHNRLHCCRITAVSSRPCVREYVFFSKSEKTRLFSFFVMSKNVKT